MNSKQQDVVVIGAGPAGLTAAYILAQSNISVTVVEADPKYVGGISRTVRYKGYLFDIGGHRFFSKSQEVEDFWREILPNDLLNRPRSSRIYYRGRFFIYPLRVFDALFKLGFLESTFAVFSYLKTKLSPVKNPSNFEEWVTNQFGKKLFKMFFKSYTEKVWGIPCNKISADWAAQRISGLSLFSAVKNALVPNFMIKRRRGKVIKTLINSFRYPRKGPGMLWETVAQKILENGGTIQMGARVVSLKLDQQTGRWIVDALIGNEKKTFTCKHVVSSAPLRELVSSLEPRIPEAVQDAANKLRYRDFVTVALIVKDRRTFSDNWIYIHDETVLVGRIQNFKSWSSELVPDPDNTCYGLEYFCFEGDKFWSLSDDSLVEVAKSEIVKIGLMKPEDFVDGCVVRQLKAYPIYDESYQKNLGLIRKHLDTHFQNLHVVGRNGMHRYNNQDHAIMTAMLTAKNILAGRKTYDVWSVNQDAEYHEGEPVPRDESTNRVAA